MMGVFNRFLRTSATCLCLFLVCVVSSPYASANHGHRQKVEVRGRDGGSKIYWLGRELKPKTPGKNSRVFRGRSLGAARDDVVIKLPKSVHSTNDLVNEANKLDGLFHPHIVSSLGRGELDGKKGNEALVLEWVEGEQLGIPFVTWKPFDAGTALEISSRLLDALEFLEQNEIRHNDLQPANIVMQEGRPETLKVLDFGHSTGSREAHRRGINDYTASEAGWKGANSDLYSVGMLLFQMVSGKTYRRGMNLEIELKWPELRAVIAKSTAMKPDNRFHDVKEFREALLLLKTSR